MGWNDYLIRNVHIDVIKSIVTFLIKIENILSLSKVNYFLKLLPELWNKCNSSMTTNQIKLLIVATNEGNLLVMI